MALCSLTLSSSKTAWQGASSAGIALSWLPWTESTSSTPGPSCCATSDSPYRAYRAQHSRRANTTAYYSLRTDRQAGRQTELSKGWRPAGRMLLLQADKSLKSYIHPLWNCVVTGKCQDWPFYSWGALTTELNIIHHQLLFIQGKLSFQLTNGCRNNTNNKYQKSLITWAMFSILKCGGELRC